MFPYKALKRIYMQQQQGKGRTIGHYVPVHKWRTHPVAGAYIAPSTGIKNVPLPDGYDTARKNEKNIINHNLIFNNHRDAAYFTAREGAAKARRFTLDRRVVGGYSLRNNNFTWHFTSIQPIFFNGMTGTSQCNGSNGTQAQDCVPLVWIACLHYIIMASEHGIDNVYDSVSSIKGEVVDENGNKETQMLSDRDVVRGGIDNDMEALVSYMGEVLSNGIKEFENSPATLGRAFLNMYLNSNIIRQFIAQNIATPRRTGTLYAVTRSLSKYHTTKSSTDCSNATASLSSTSWGI